MEKESKAKHWARDRGRIRHVLLGEQPHAAMVLSLFLGMCLAISLADLFIPLFWRYAFSFRFGFVLIATLFLSLAVLPTVSRSFTRPFATLAPLKRFLWVLTWLCLISLGIAVLAGAAYRLFQLASIESQAVRHAGNSPSAAQSIEISYLFFVAVLLGLPRTKSAHPVWDSTRGVYVPIVFLALCFLGIYFINNLLPLIDTNLWQFRFPEIVLIGKPVGLDFRLGLYEPARLLLSQSYLYASQGPDMNMYPPLVAVFALPYLLFGENAAYILHVFLLFASNIVCLSLAALLARDYSGSRSDSPGGLAAAIHLILWVLVAFNLFSSYPFLFSLERGNMDAFAMVFSLATLWILLKHAERIWLQVILLSIAVHLKVYPVFLFALLLFVHRSKIVIPSVLVNAAFLMILGPTNAMGFLHNILQVTAVDPGQWVGNHSGYSFAWTLGPFVSPAVLPVHVMRVLFTCVPVLIWGMAWLPLARIQNREQAVLAAFMITIPLMETFPTLSYDYKLVITSSAVLILLSRILTRMRVVQDWSDYLQLLTVSAIMLWIGRSYALTDPSLSVIRIKYPWIILLEIIMLMNIFQQVRDGDCPTNLAVVDAEEPIPAGYS